MSDDVRERLAGVQHAIWAHWMRYMFTQGTVNPDGSWTMPAEKAARWGGQMRTPYSDLTEKERESDREQADKIILSIRHLLAGPGPDIVYDTWHELQRQKWQDIKLENPHIVQHI